ncbi:MAG: zinc carboxypeptidase [Firmicutes bacterium]|nr:zinc carboxypeptidase [Bacillota bacterium]
MKTTFTYDHYFKYDELKKMLEYFAATYPDLAELEVNCVTEEGRNQYVITLTNKKTGYALSKPGWYLDGNIHAGEVTSTQAAMHTVDYLLTNYGSDVQATKLLDEMTIYVIPRVTPDGAETYLTTTKTLRSVNRDYQGEPGGIDGQDLDGDDVVRMMRIPTPYGAWKIDPKDPSTMTLRDPGDAEGVFYDIYPEGVLEDYDGSENLKQKKTPWGLDFNRNFPLGWFPDSRQPGAGKYPLSNPETKAIVDFVLAHPNIGGAAIGHTSGGILLYPPGTRAAKTAPAADIDAFKAIAAMGQEELGYLPMNIFDSFMTDQEQFDSGALDDWMYQSQGIPAYTVEFWDIATKAGVPMDWGQERFGDPKKSIQRFNACIKWVKENAPEYYMDWTEYEHPVFGKVEIGGFHYKFTHQNPPPKFLLAECENDTRFNIRFALAMPKLVIEDFSAEKVEDGVYKVTAIVGNRGYLPTNLTDEAFKLKVAKPVYVKLDGAELLSGKAEEKVESLSGYSRTATGVFFYGNITTSESAPAKKKFSWIVKAKAGDVLKLTAKNEKAGVKTQEITLA